MEKKWLLVVFAMTCARRSPQNGGREKLVGLDGAPQEFSLADNMLLTDVFVRCVRPHACCERCFGLHAFLESVVEERDSIITSTEDAVCPWKCDMLKMPKREIVRAFCLARCVELFIFGRWHMAEEELLVVDR